MSADAGSFDAHVFCPRCRLGFRLGASIIEGVDEEGGRGYSHTGGERAWGTPSADPDECVDANDELTTCFICGYEVDVLWLSERLAVALREERQQREGRDQADGWRHDS